MSAFKENEAYRLVGHVLRKPYAWSMVLSRRRKRVTTTVVNAWLHISGCQSLENHPLLDLTILKIASSR